MRKDLCVCLSWMSDENWRRAIEIGFLPILAINHPRNFEGTQIHFPDLAPKMKYLKKIEDIEEAKDMYWDSLSRVVSPWKTLHTFDILAHLSSASGVMIFTERKEDPFREILGQYLDGILNFKIREYEWA